MTTRLPWAEARQAAHAAGQSRSLLPELLPLDKSIGRLLAVDVTTSIDIPHFASSAMDGWAVTGEGPWRVTRAGRRAGEARKVVTGDVVFDDEFAVLRLESGTTDEDILFSARLDEPRPGQHVRPTAAEADHGETLIRKGTLLNPAHIALAASAGIDHLEVSAEPGVHLLLTGDEVITQGVPGVGQVRDSFGVQLPAVLRLLGAEVRESSRVRDDLTATSQAIEESTAPLVISTGGTGSSSADHVRRALRGLGADILVDGIAMRPGGPSRIARLPDGRLIVCLPGNPLAAMVVAISILEPLIAGMAGRDPRAFDLTRGLHFEGRPGSTLLVPVQVRDQRPSPAAWRGAAMMRGLADADALLVVPEAGCGLDDPARLLTLPWRQASPAWLLGAR
ncbi:molybdopterin molybdotransferase MoeA [Microbacterium sp. A8/3-1]|uniref:Molybdopterin molybdenumtransferase n=1 Tax=Microbacterium sp. A8/3-1 TaxID=3160749 RepID=A0AAU7VVW2_9MICO